ncbi:MAG: VOC family protein [Proteobacteria bacterium]|nr:VOC family protein [Pseudomonadota bacterium]
MDYKLFAIRVFVRDWERAVRFYTETLGMPLAYRSDELGWAQLATGECQLALERAAPDDEESQALVGRFVGVSLQVSDIQATVATLQERGVEFAGLPEAQEWGGVLAHLRDPDGNVLTLLGSRE